MRYVSIDIETTGLDAETCEILEVGAVISTEAALERLPTFRYRFLRDSYKGEPYALSMHKDLFRDLATKKRNTGLGRYCGEYCGNYSSGLLEKDWYGSECEFLRYFAEWLRSWGIDPVNFVAAGKNFAHFDEPFLQKIKGTEPVQWHHRILDPGSMFVLPSDEVVPDTNECCKRAGINPADIPGDPHTAIHDALVVIALIRKGFERHVQA